MPSGIFSKMVADPLIPHLDVVGCVTFGLWNAIVACDNCTILTPVSNYLDTCERE